MKRNLMALAVGTASVFCALPVGAQMLSQPQFYVGAGAGRVDSGDTDNSWKLYAGGELNRNFAVEAAYNDLGSYRTADITSWSLAAIGKLPLDNMWSVFAKAGVTSNRAKNGISERNTEPLLGVGVGLDFNRNMGVRLEYEDFGNTPVVAGRDERISNWALSLNYRF